ncbi:MAG: hypothetical protein J6N73_05060 [Prevotella sp.]|jgi:hypothetical protein|nr:hypothetical protein [Prevotella sp.]
MTKAFVIFGIVFLIGILLVVYKYQHRKDLHDDVDQLKSVINQIFEEAETPTVSQNRLIKGLKQHLGINEKMALKLIGKARHEELLEIESTDFKKIGKIQYKKKFE